MKRAPKYSSPQNGTWREIVNSQLASLNAELKARNARLLADQVSNIMTNHVIPATTDAWKRYLTNRRAGRV